MSWKSVALGDVCSIINGGTPKSEVADYWGGELNWITPKEMGKLKSREISVTERKITDKGIKNSSAKLLPINSVILSSRAPIGHLAINKSLMATNQGCKGLVPFEALNYEYLYYFLSYSKQLLNDMGSGATFKELSSSKLATVEIPLPPLSIQKEIVSKLDAIFIEIEKAIVATDANAKNAEALFQSLLSEVLTENKHKNKELTLDDVCDLITCGVAKRPEYVDSGIPFLSAKNVKKQKIIWNDYQFVSVATHSELTKHNKPLKGDILYTRVGSYGEAAIIDKDCEFSIFVSLTLIKPKTEIVTNKFLVYFLNSAQTKALASRSISGSGVGNLNVGTVRKFIINLPSIKEQGEIVKKLDSIKANCDSLANSYRRKYQSLCLYKESILKKAFNGELIKE